MLWQARTGLLSNTAPYSPAGAGGGATYAYLGQFNSTSLPAGVVVMPFTMTSTAGLLSVFFGVQNSKTITSVIYDPTGANVTLTQDTFNNTGNTVGMWSGVIPSASGSKNVEVTVSGGAQFLGAAGHAWLVANQTANVAQTVASATSTGTVNISVTAGNFLFGGAFNLSGITAVDWATSTQVPFSTHASATNLGWGGDWTIASTNASFACTPKVANNFYQAYATYR